MTLASLSLDAARLIYAAPLDALPVQYVEVYRAPAEWGRSMKFKGRLPSPSGPPPPEAVRITIPGSIAGMGEETRPRAERDFVLDMARVARRDLLQTNWHVFQAWAYYGGR